MIREQLAKIFKRSTGVSEYGTEVTSWIDLGNVSGYLDTISTSKSEVAGKIVQDSTHMFLTREIEDIKQGDRLKFGASMYEINYVDNPMDMNHHLEIELKLVPEQETQTENLMYFGFMSTTDVSEMDILGLGSQAIKAKAFSATLTADATNLVLAYPKTFGKSSIRINNKLITNWNIQELTINGVTHFVYSTEVADGAIKIELF